MHIDVHTSAPITEAPDHVVWQLNDDAPLENSVPELIKALESKKYAASGTSATDFVHLFILVPAQKARPQDLDPKESGKPMLWTTVAKAPEFFPNRHLILRRLTAEDEEYLNKVKSGEIDPDIPEPPSGQLPDMPPPALEPTGPETGVATMTADIPRYNEVQVSGTLPLQHLKISTLSWKARPIRATPGIRNRPVSTATMCPSCGQPFAMNITDDLAKKQQLTKDMERELDDALEAQRTVLDGERKMLEAEANDLKTAIASVNASLARTRDDGEELRTLSEQQASWTKWLEGEIRQSKAEIGQVGIDFDACLKSNEQLSGVVGSAAASRAESRYHNTNINRRDGPLPNTAPLYLAHGDQSSPTYQPAAAAYSRSYAQKRGETPRKARMRDIVTRYYQKHNPNKLGLVETLVDEYEGKERELLFLMAQKYGDRSILSHDVGEDFAPSSGYPSSSTDTAPLDAQRFARHSRHNRKIEDLLSSFVGDEDHHDDRYRTASPSYPAPLPVGGAPVVESSSASGFSADKRGGFPGSLYGPPSSDPSKVTFDLPHSNGLRDELMRIAPQTMENRRQGGGR